MSDYGQHVNFIWSIAETLRGNYKQSEYGKVVLPFTVLRRLDAVLAPTKTAVFNKSLTLPPTIDDTMRDMMLNMVSGHKFHNISKFSFANLLDDPDNIAANLNNMINGFSADAREIFIERFDLPNEIARLDKSNLLYLIVKQFAGIDLHPDKVDGLAMGYIFEELIRRFSEQSNETAGEHFTPREVIRLMVNLLFEEDGDALTKKGIIRRLYDPACGTGGMLSVAEEYLRELNPDAHLEVYGQELNDESYAICKSDMMIKGQNAKNIYAGNSFSKDGLPDQQFDYMLSNPPFGVEWKKVQDVIKEEHGELGYNGRFGPGLPRVSDGSLLFVMHMISKFNRAKPAPHLNPPPEGGRKLSPLPFGERVRERGSDLSGLDASRLAVVLNGSPLFTGGAGSGESEIRRWIIENDWLEAIVALPTDMFYNTGIATYIWIITSQKTAQRKGKIQLINATGFHSPMRKSLGSKRKQIAAADIETITHLFGDGVDGNGADEPLSKIFDNTDFGYRRITVERPLKLNFQANPERIEGLKAGKAFARLKADVQEKLLAALMDSRLRGNDNSGGVIPAKAGIHSFPTLYTDRADFIADVKAATAEQGLKLSASQLKMVWGALSERDDTAPPCRDKKGNIEADSSLRDYEDVPLKEDINDYFEREVLSNFPDRWIRDENSIVGYEINFHKIFSPIFFEEGTSAIRFESLLLTSPADNNVVYQPFTATFIRKKQSKKPHSISLALDTNKVNIDYLNLYLNSDAGQEWLQYYQRGTGITNFMSKRTLLSTKIELPSMEQQTKIVSLFLDAKRIQHTVSIISQSIWNDTAKSEDLLSGYSNITIKGENNYISSLPYPLAVLLNHAVNELDEKEKCDVYLKFFEYAGSIALGSVVGELPKAERAFLKLPRNGITMGYYDYRLKKMKEKDVKFRAAYATFVQDDFVDIFSDAREIRNEVSHAGIPNKKTISERWRALENLIDKFRLITKDFFHEYKLFRPKYAKCFPDYFEFTIDVFSGLASKPFNKTIIKTRNCLLDNTLYWGAVDGAVQADDFCQCYLASPLITLSEVEDGLGIEDFYFLSSIEKESTKAKYTCPYHSIKEHITVESNAKAFLM